MSSGKFLSFIFLVFLGGAMMPSAYGQNTPALNINIPAMMEEVKIDVLSESRVHTYITEIVERHIPIGANEKDVIKAFEAAGFESEDDTEKDYNGNERKKYDKIFYFVSDFSLFPKYFWKHKIGILVKYKDGKIAYRSGSVSYDNPILKYLP